MANQQTVTTTNRGAVVSDVVRHMEQHYSLDDVLFAGSQAAVHKIGQLMKDGGGGKQVAITAATDTVTGIILQDLDATPAGDIEGYMLTRKAELASAGLIYFTGATAANITTLNVKLNALGLVVRTSV